MGFYWTLFVVLAAIVTGELLTSAQESTDRLAVYRFRYFVRDEGTGDIKAQSEVRQGDDVQGSYSVAEPNGNTRVVTYTAGKDTGFKARVQVRPGKPSNPQLAATDPEWNYFMNLPPRNIYRPQQVEIKVFPPSTTEPPINQVTQKPPFTPEEEQKLREQDKTGSGYSEQNVEVSNSSTSTVVHHETNPLPSPSELYSKCTTGNCPNEDEVRGRIKQEGDKVQLEMEKVIRTEMKEPSSVNVGKPYQAPNQPPRSTTTSPFPNFPLHRTDMIPVYMKPLYMSSSGPNFPPDWPPIVNLRGRLYMPHIAVQHEDIPPAIFPKRVYLVPVPSYIQMNPGHVTLLPRKTPERQPQPNQQKQMQVNPAFSHLFSQREHQGETKPL